MVVSEAPSSGLVIDQARKTGFTIRNRDQLSAALKNNDLVTDDSATPDTPKEKYSSGLFIDETRGTPR